MFCALLHVGVDLGDPREGRQQPAQRRRARGRVNPPGRRVAKVAACTSPLMNRSGSGEEVGGALLAQILEDREIHRAGGIGEAAAHLDVLGEDDADRALQEGLGFEQLVAAFGHLDRVAVGLPDEAAAEHVGVQRPDEHGRAVEREPPATPGGGRAPAARPAAAAPAARRRRASRSPAGGSVLGQPQARFDRAGHERQAREHAAHLFRWTDYGVAGEIDPEEARLRSAMPPRPARCSAATPTGPG